MAVSWLSATVLSPLPLVVGGPHGHSVSHVWAHGHLHTVSHHQNDPAESRVSTLIAFGDLSGEAVHDSAHVTHTVSVDLPPGVSAQVAGLNSPPSVTRFFFRAPARANAPPYPALLVKPPTLALLRTTGLLV